VASPAADPARRREAWQEIAWRIFTKGIARGAAAQQVRVSGDADLGGHMLRMITIVG
jgi:hypothetical protein